LIQKKQKIKSVEMLLCRTRPFPANQAKPGLGTFAPLTLIAITLLQKSRYALPPHKAIIVLPDFIRSCSTDGEGKNIQASPRVIARDEAIFT
jgi:hypothetical protein